MFDGRYTWLALRTVEGCETSVFSFLCFHVTCNSLHSLDYNFLSLTSSGEIRYKIRLRVGSDPVLIRMVFASRYFVTAEQFSVPQVDDLKKMISDREEIDEDGFED